MTRSLRRDQRGVVYVEFILAFIPVFVFFLGIIQVSLLSAARLVVQHAASRAVRAAIVVLEDDPREHGGAPRGNLVEGHPSERAHQRLARLIPGSSVYAFAATAARIASGSLAKNQDGARMEPIRFAAYLPLAILAPPSASSEKDERVSVTSSLSRSSLLWSIPYNDAAAAVTVHLAPGAEAPPVDHVPLDHGLVTVRIVYLYSCSVPLARRFLCSSVEDVTDEVRSEDHDDVPMLANSASPAGISRFVGAGARFSRIAAEASLPNQGARYEPRDPS